MKLKLWELSKQYRELLESIDDISDSEAIQDTLESVEGTLQVKAQNTIAYTEELQMVVDRAKDIVKQKKELIKVIQNKIDSIKNYVKVNMEINYINEIITDDFILKLKDNPPKVIILDESVIPAKHVKEKTTYSIDKKSISASLKSGQRVNGAELQQTKRLEIK